MRWAEPVVAPPKDGDQRECSAFLFFPKTINGETRWLERARWLQVYTQEEDDLGPYCGRWSAIRWLRTGDEA